MAVPTTLHIGRPCMPCTPGRVRGLGGGGAGLSPCHRPGVEGGGRAGEEGGEGGGGGLGGAPCASAEGGGYGHPPCAVSLGWRDVLRPCARQYWVEGLGLHPCAHQHKVEGTVAVAPLLPTPAPLPIVGLWECCIAAPGPLRTYRRWCTRRTVAPLVWLLHHGLPSPRYHRGGSGRGDGGGSGGSVGGGSGGAIWGGGGGHRLPLPPLALPLG